MSSARVMTAPLSHADRFYLGGEWVKPASDGMIDVIDSGTEELYFSIAEATAPDMSHAVGAARHAFDDGPWPRMSHAERAGYLRALGAGLQERNEDLGQIWPRESGVVYSIAQYSGMGAVGAFEAYAALADTFPFEEPAQPTMGGNFGLLVREPVGVVGAIIPWNAPVALICTRPCFSTMALGIPSPAAMRSNTSLAIFDEITPSSISWAYCDSIGTVMCSTPSAVTSAPEAFAKVRTDWVMVLAISFGSWPTTAAS